MISLLQCLEDDAPTQPDAEWKIRSNWLYDELRMLFDSRPRFSDIEITSVLSGTILNFGLDESRLVSNATQTRMDIFQQRITDLLAHFEPRLSDVNIQVKKAHLPQVAFSLNANWQGTAVNFELIWNDAMNTFYLNEMA